MRISRRVCISAHTRGLHDVIIGMTSKEIHHVNSWVVVEVQVPSLICSLYSSISPNMKTIFHLHNIEVVALSPKARAFLLRRSPGIFNAFLRADDATREIRRYGLNTSKSSKDFFE